jgi:23S rRNA (adenine2503-C2)-methyltransferase
MKRYDVPTGTILQIMGERGKLLECLSLGDYGKSKNIKADFLGFTDKIECVTHGELLPLHEKWVVTISTQYGCSMGCRFCDVPKVGPGINASILDMIAQVQAAISIHPEIKFTNRLNLHYARMGEPTFNLDVISSAKFFHKELKERRGWGFHPVVSTMLPKSNNLLEDFLRRWLYMKMEFGGDAGLQISINTTDEERRKRDFGGNSMELSEASKMFKRLPKQTTGRKNALNIALTDGAIDAGRLAELFSPSDFMVKITPMHKTSSAITNGLYDSTFYRKYAPYESAEDVLKKVGFDVLVFIPSFEEDAGRITCGNAVLSGSVPLQKKMMGAA